MKEQMVNTNGIMEYIKNQNEILDLTIFKMKHSWVDLKRHCQIQKYILVNSKINRNDLNRRERKNLNRC